MHLIIVSSKRQLSKYTLKSSSCYNLVTKLLQMCMRIYESTDLFTICIFFINILFVCSLKHARVMDIKNCIYCFSRFKYILYHLPVSN